MTTTTPTAEERQARTKVRQAEKARKARARELDSARWRKVCEYRRQQGSACKCELRSGMCWEELLELGSGCTGSDARGHLGWVCPVLDYYRQLVRRSG